MDLLRAKCVLLLLLVSSFFSVPFVAQLIELHDVSAPPVGSLRVIHAFTVFARGDVSVGKEPSTATLEVDGISSAGKSVTNLTEVFGIGLVEFDLFWREVVSLPHKDGRQVLFCQMTHTAENMASVPLWVEFKQNLTAAQVSAVIDKTGVYLLVISNCGSTALSDYRFHGKIKVRNPYGFLPGNEFPKLSFYGVLVLVYSVLSLLWATGVLIQRRGSRTVTMQYAILAVAVWSLVESLLWLGFLYFWNQNGKKSDLSLGLASIGSVVKTLLAYLLVLVASLGWGIVTPVLERTVKMKIKLLAIFYLVLDGARVVVSLQSTTNQQFVWLTILVLLPVALIHSVIFMWIMTALTSLMKQLTEQRQTEKLMVFRKLTTILVVSMGLATTAFLVEIAYLSQDLNTRWKSQWWLTDGIPQLLCMSVLVAVMLLWSPHKDRRRYAFSTQLPNQEELNDDRKKKHYINEDVETTISTRADGRTSSKNRTTSGIWDIDIDDDDDYDADVASPRSIGKPITSGL